MGAVVVQAECAGRAWNACKLGLVLPICMVGFRLGGVPPEELEPGLERLWRSNRDRDGHGGGDIPGPCRV